MLTERIKEAIREIPNFPKDGIDFKDITPILKKPALCEEIVKALQKQYENQSIHAIAGIESRGFWFGMLLAQALKIPFIPIRKLGKLPYETNSYSYELEYGKATMEIHTDALQPGWNVLIHDDLLATGGTACAAAELVLMQKANIAGFAFLVELSFLDANDKLKKYSSHIHSLVTY